MPAIEPILLAAACINTFERHTGVDNLAESTGFSMPLYRSGTSGAAMRGSLSVAAPVDTRPIGR